MINHTPVIKQYLRIKKNYPDELVFFRMGDFYELFYKDAEEASKILGITLTNRGKSAGQPVVMAGVPVSSHQNYLKRLIDLGKTVAICEQDDNVITEKGLVDRKVVRIVTSGTLCDEGLINEKKQIWLCSLSISGVLSWIDVTTGELFWFSQNELDNKKKFSYEQIFTIISKLDIGEILVSERIQDLKFKTQKEYLENILFYLKEIVSEKKIIFRPDWEFDANVGKSLLQKRLNITFLNALELSNNFSALESIGSLITYAEKNIGKPLLHLRLPQKFFQSETVIIDASAQKALELKKPLFDEDKKNITLIACLDQCKTSGGSRELRKWMLSPLISNKDLKKRQKSIIWISKNIFLHQVLTGVIDICRIAGRISLGNTSPRELNTLALNLKKMVEISQSIEDIEDYNIKKIYKNFSDSESELIINTIQNYLSEDPPVKVKQGNFIRNGFDKSLDDLRKIKTDISNFLSKLELDEREKSKISNLKIGFSPVHGYYFEVTQSQKNKVPEHYHRKQTLKNSERYTTIKLRELEEKILSAKDKSIERENIIFQNLLIELRKHINFLFRLSDSVNLLDALTSLALKISEKKWVIPELSENSEINIKQGFHPVLGNNKLEGDYENNFYPNDTLLTSNKNMMLLTGPNMSGKSTYMKQVALITILGRMGAPVPASYAKIGVIDRIFTRIGAADDLAGGRSTFMVEMTEAAKILHKSTKKSLVIMDEIGRGTSTSDGLALAIAIATEINKVNQSLCLFATHYFEITELSKQLKGVENFHISTKERDDQIVFLYELKKGPASKSFGLKVAKLAGIPNSVLNYANSIKLPTNHEILVETEQEISKNILEQNKGMEIINEIVNIDPNVCSPKLALDLIFKWKKSLDS